MTENFRNLFKDKYIDLRISQQTSIRISEKESPLEYIIIELLKNKDRQQPKKTPFHIQKNTDQK